MSATTKTPLDSTNILPKWPVEKKDINNTLVNCAVKIIASNNSTLFNINIAKCSANELQEILKTLKTEAHKNNFKNLLENFISTRKNDYMFSVEIVKNFCEKLRMDINALLKDSENKFKLEKQDQKNKDKKIRLKNTQLSFKRSFTATRFRMTATL